MTDEMVGWRGSGANLVGVAAGTFSYVQTNPLGCRQQWGTGDALERSVEGLGSGKLSSEDLRLRAV